MKAHRYRINFVDNPDDLEAATLAKGGMATALIMQRTGLSAGQVQTRKTRLKQIEKPNWAKKKGIGYYRAWALGLSQESQDWLETVAPKIKRQLERTLPTQIVHPTPKIVEMKYFRKAA